MDDIPARLITVSWLVLAVLTKLITVSWLVLGQMAPFLLLGFLVAGVLSVCVSPAWVERHLGRRGLGPVLTASLFGVPLPLCSCGVIPVSASIRRHGASRAATTAFLLSTPQTGVDSIAVTWGLLGPAFAIFRPLVALLTGLVGGGLILLFGEPEHSDAAGEPKSPTCTEACCAAPSSQNVVLRVLHYGFVTLPRDIGVALLVGIVIAGAITALLKPDQWQPYIGGGIVSILLMMAVGVPVYVCATASVAMAAAFIYAGASPGAALAFLIAGPATNAATFTTILKLLGRRTALLYLLTVAASAIICGLTLDWLFPDLKDSIPLPGHHDHATSGIGWFARHLSAVVLLAVLAYSFRAAAGRGKAKDHAAEAGAGARASADRGRLELRITGMTCSHCAESVRRALAECEGVNSAEVDLGSGRAFLSGDRLDPDRLAAAVAELGYSAKLPE